MKNKDLLTVGTVAKEMDVIVRTLQYSDKQGLLNPSFKSEGGRRLYTKKDMVKLHQILSLKYLGFSLDEIKDNILSFDNPMKVARILES
ncbi:MerR family transcriptional regulator [Clostridium sp.]|uniref:MerR family transcriptional regulator n=1 Tax=Clostridium sp. TaxID=1506 RepID=UPI002FC98B74